MRQFFVKTKINDLLYLSAEDYHHAVNVLRIKLQEKVCCVYQNQPYLCQVDQISSNQIACLILAKMPLTTKNYQTTFYLPVSKQKNWDLMVEKLTELGCDCFIPVYFHYSQKNDLIRIERLNKIIISAAKQANRYYLPEVKQPIQFKEMIEQLKDYQIVLLADERCRNQKINNQLVNKKIKNAALIVGPSAGFATHEFEILKDKVISIKLNDNILRSETAAISLINYWYFMMEVFN
ncbi:16S rRNA (uracil(1498)-N(3))-methyltransferase [[Mycoplasma] cavipharyngis]|uniref:RsmE family RNA methyltransferase n=1 Tax=[Mycoplasma] cavipharyngis TaxID=92757 RepID=UPI0037039445